MITLGIDTSSDTASVAICKDGKVIAQTTFVTKLTHSQIILPLVTRVLDDAELNINDIDYYAVANGPGSYTGLRIGIAAIKGIAFAQNKQCCGVSTLMSLAYNCVGAKGTIISLIKAREKVSYYGIFNSDGNNLVQICEDSIDTISNIVEHIKDIKGDIILIGDYAANVYEEDLTGNSHIRLAPQNLNISLASSLCYLAEIIGFNDPEKLEASYLQITKAEKIKINK